MAVNGLALGGGGSRGSYEIGVWRGLKELDWQPQIITGTSVGALNGALIAGGDYDLAVKLWQETSTKQVIELKNYEHLAAAANMLKKAEIYLKSLSREDVGLSTKPLGKLLEKTIDEEKIRQSGLEFGLVTILWEKPKLIPQQLFLEDIPRGKLNDYLWASASLYPALKAHTIDGKPYIDGGYYNNIPMDMAFAKGADSVLAVDLDIFGLTKRPELTSNQELRIIKPFWPLGSILQFDGARAKDNMSLGYLDTLKTFNRYKGCYYTFHHQAFRERTPLQSQKIQRLLAALKTGEKHNLTALAIGNAQDLLSKKYRQNWALTENMWEISIEAAAEVFQLSPRQAYSEAEFLSAMKKAVQNHLTKEKIRSRLGFSKTYSLKRRLKLIDAPSRSLILRKHLDEAMDKDTPSIQKTEALLFPVEFMAAIFLHLFKI